MATYKIANFSEDPAGWEHGNPFHGDTYIIDDIYDCMKRSDIFIETGTSYAESSYFIADNFVNKKVYTCEVDDRRFSISQDLLKEFKNVYLQRMMSPHFLYYVLGKEPNLNNKKCVFWLDAHGEWEENGETMYAWPLFDEVEFVTINLKNYTIFIDDFQNPYVPQSKFDVCNNGTKICGPSEVMGALNGAKLYVPTYTNVTSEYHEDIIGIGLITDMDLNEALPNSASGWKEVK
jgi:hypothetical protein